MRLCYECNVVEICFIEPALGMSRYALSARLKETQWGNLMERPFWLQVADALR